MRLANLITAAVALCFSSPAFAQNWSEYINIEDRFTISMPADVTVEEITYVTEDGSPLPARRHSAEWNGNRYAVISVDFAQGYEAHDTVVQGSMAHAATNYRQLGEATYDAYARINRIPSHQLYITQPDGRRLYVVIVLHQDNNLDARRLIILEANSPAGARPPTLFLTSLSVLDPEGNRVRYEPDLITRTQGF